METLRQWRSHLDVLDVRLFKLGDTGVTLWGLLLFVSLVVALMYLAGWLQRWMVNRVLAHAHHLDLSVRQAIASVLRYVVILVGFLVIVHDADPHLAGKLIHEAALENADVLKEPPPMAHLLGMTAGAFAFELTAWTSAVQRKSAIISELNFAINDKLMANSIKLG